MNVLAEHLVLRPQPQVLLLNPVHAACQLLHVKYEAVFGIRNRIRIRVHMFLSLPDPDRDPLVRGMDPDPDSYIIKQK